MHRAATLPAASTRGAEHSRSGHDHVFHVVPGVCRHGSATPSGLRRRLRLNATVPTSVRGLVAAPTGRGACAAATSCEPPASSNRAHPQRLRGPRYADEPDSQDNKQLEVLEDAADRAPQAGTFQEARRLSSLPATQIRPEVGRSSLVSRRRKVDLPEPDWPTMKTNSPLLTGPRRRRGLGRRSRRSCRRGRA